MFDLYWYPTADGMAIAGDLARAARLRDELLAENPNMLFLVGITHTTGDFPEDSPYWLRDPSGNRVPDPGWHSFWLDYTHEDVQNMVVQKALAVERCGLYDGIFLDHWNDYPRLHGYRSLAEERAAKDAILQRIRREARTDFLIMVNTNRETIPRWASYVNGTFMETVQEGDGYTHQELIEIEATLSWSEDNFRHPQINGLEGWGDEKVPLDSPGNKQWMRLFTTMSLTHSDGYVVFVTGIGGAIHDHSYGIWEGHSAEHAQGRIHDHQHEHYWYDFWDAPLGRPIGEKAQRYHDRDGVFVREFTGGWAVYNRSGRAQQIRLSEPATGVESGIRGRTHTIPDLDGEIYLKADAAADTSAGLSQATS